MLNTAHHQNQSQYSHWSEGPSWRQGQPPFVTLPLVCDLYISGILRPQKSIQKQLAPSSGREFIMEYTMLSETFEGTENGVLRTWRFLGHWGEGSQGKYNYWRRWNETQFSISFYWALYLHGDHRMGSFGLCWFNTFSPIFFTSGNTISRLKN